MKHICILLYFNFCYQFVISQNNIIILDSSTNKPIQLASIKVIHQPKGFYSNDKGIFNLTGINKYDTLLISCIGYNNKFVEVKYLSNNTTISLIPKAIKLEDVIINSSLPIYTIEYPTKKNQYLTSNITTEEAFKVLIPDKDRDRLIKILTIKLMLKKEKDNYLCRLHIYSVGKDGYPNEEILKNNIYIVDNQISHKEVSLDISKYNITTSDTALFIGIEWIGKTEINKYNEMGPKIGVGICLNESRTYTRTLLEKNYEWILQKSGYPIYNMMVSIIYK